MNPTKFTLRNVRILHAGFLLSMFLYILILRLIKAPDQTVPAGTVLAFAFVAFSDVGIALFIRSGKVRAAEKILRTQPNDAGALNQWRVGMIVSFALAETIALLGLALKFLGVEWKIAGAFFALAIFLMLLWMPRLDAAEAR
jgi:F0F1-type ATP synthase membrane subunit c/vacuolar-type H+-ATPase subunit K